MRLIASFVDAYLRLNEAEERRFRESRALAKLDPEKREAVMEYVTSWEERGMRQGFLKGMEEGIEKGLEKGIEQGMEAGRLETLREVLLDVLATRFGPLQPTLSERVQKIESSDELRRLTHAALTAASLQDLSL